MNAIELKELRIRGFPWLTHETLTEGVGAFVAPSRPFLQAWYRVLAGLDRPFGGRVRLSGQDPYKNPELRSRLGFLFPEEPPLPAQAANSSAPQDAPLFPSWQSWKKIPAHQLNSEQRRAFHLQLALRKERPFALILHEPFLTVAPAEEELLSARLTQLAQAGTLLLLTTYQAQTALRFSPAPWTVRATGSRLPTPAPYCTLLVRAEISPELLRALEQHSAVRSLDYSARAPHELRVHGAEPAQLSQIVQALLAQYELPVREISFLAARSPRPLPTLSPPARRNS